MNKKITIIDVINKIVKGEIPKAIKYHNKIYKYVKNEDEEGYLNADFGGDWLTNIIHWDDVKELNQEVKIIEEEPEIDIQEIQELPDENYGIKRNTDKINELLQAVKQLDKRINGNKNGE